MEPATTDEVTLLIAGYLSTIGFTPARHHPEEMLPYAARVMEIVKERYPLMTRLYDAAEYRKFLGEPPCGNPDCACQS